MFVRFQPLIVPGLLMLLVGLSLAGGDVPAGSERTAAVAPTNDVGTDSGPSLYAGRTVDQWRTVMKTLSLTSPAAAEAVPGLIALCRDSSVPQQTRAQAAYTLGRIGTAAESAVPLFVELLQAASDADSFESARWAAKALALLGSVAAAATPELAQAAADETQPLSVRQACLEALGRIGGSHSQAIPALIELMESSSGDDESLPSERVREAAVDSLTFVGPPAAAAVPILIRLTRDPQWPIRYRSALALASIGPAAEIAAQALAELVLFDDVTEVRRAAADALGRIGPVGRSALVQLLSDEDVDVRHNAASAFARLKQLDEVSRPGLVTALNDPDINIRLLVAESLQKCGHDQTTLAPILLEALADGERQPRMHAFRLIRAMDPATPGLLPQLRALAEDERPDVGRVASKLVDELTAP